MQINPCNEENFTFTELAHSNNTTETQYAIADLKQFNYIVITYGGALSPLYSVVAFKTLGDKLIKFAPDVVGGNAFRANVRYVDDTHIKIQNSQASYTYVYGVK